MTTLELTNTATALAAEVGRLNATDLQSDHGLWDSLWALGKALLISVDGGPRDGVLQRAGGVGPVHFGNRYPGSP